MRSLRRVGAIALTSGLLSVNAQASVIGVIDSGLDTQHKDLVGHIWLNLGDSTTDGVDDDNNGFRDDVNGWNFVGNNGTLIERKYSKLYDDEVARFFATQTKALEGKASSEEIDWMKTSVTKKEFVQKLQTFGNYVHGTHVSGITVRGNEEAKALGAKLIPTENPLAGIIGRKSVLEGDVRKAADEGKELNWIVKEIIKGGLGFFAKSQATVFGNVGIYLNEQKVDVANASLGMGLMQAEMIVKPLLKLAGRGKDPSPELVKELAIFFLERVNAEQQILLRSAPETLFVFAAGNEGINNDEYPTAPASIDHPYKLAVAASFADGRLAPFSNYGVKRVDIAAPGVGIVSTIPDDHQLALSGTSQAAPYVTGVAAHVKDINPSLNPIDIKAILMQTVDKLDALKDKVKSGGVLNEKRALLAAELSLEKPLAKAIAEAQAQVGNIVKDQVQNRSQHAVWIPVPEAM